MPPVLGWSLFVLNLTIVPKIKEEQWGFLSTEVLSGRNNHSKGHKTIWLDSDFFLC